jgi:hypothetical protein
MVIFVFSEEMQRSVNLIMLRISMVPITLNPHKALAWPVAVLSAVIFF